VAKRGTSSQAQLAERFEEGIKSVDEGSPYLNLCAYGRNGSGKTRLGATAPSPLIIDINEEGTRSAVGTGAEVREVMTFDEVAHGYWYLKAGNHSYETVVVDTVTALHQAAIRKVLGDQEDRDPTREPSQPDKRTWGRANQLMNQLVMDFRNLPMHVIFLVQERVIQDDDSDEPAFHTLDLPAGARSTLLGAVGITGRLFAREVKIKGSRRTKWVDFMLVGPHEQYDSKDRTGSLGMVVKQVTIPKLITAWENRTDKE
jgi:hypothetical protein